MATSKNITDNEIKTLLETLQKRFSLHVHIHPDLSWNNLEAKLMADKSKLFSLFEMERTGGEPNVVKYLKDTNEYVFFDCAAESPKGRRSLCYDKKAWESRKKFKPEDNAVDVAKAMGVELLNEEQYKYLQTLGEFDLKTSSWLHTQDKIRNLGGAIFGDRRFDTVFVYHNGAESYYAARGFRAFLNV